MKISELISKLEDLFLEHGDVEVVAVNGCGCCDTAGEPTPMFYAKHRDPRYTYGPEGVYLN